MRFRRNRFFLGIVHLALLGTVYSCSEDDSSGLTGGSGPGGAGKASQGGSAGTIGTGGVAASGGSSAGKGGSGNTGNIPTEACPGLPFEDPNPASGGEPGAPAGGAPAGGAPAGGAPAGGAPSAEGGAGGAPSAEGGAPTASGGAPAEACLGIEFEAERVDVDMFIMMDSSSSMGYTLASGETRWEALTAAVEEFVQSPDAVDIGAGVGFFGISGHGDDNLDCDVSNYADPVVGIGPLADTGADIIAAMQAQMPAGLTPMVPALEGALDYASGWQADHQDRATVVVLVSDGYPTQCVGGPETVAATAEASFAAAPYVKTYIVGVGEVARFNLDNYARAGGTESAFLTSEDDASGSFVEALRNITGNEIACEYEIPEPPDDMTIVDVDKVQIVYTPQGGVPEEVPRVNALGDCADAENGGWYYDNATTPTRIYVCPCTCARFGAGAVDVRIGCEPRLGLR